MNHRTPRPSLAATLAAPAAMLVLSAGCTRANFDDPGGGGDDVGGAANGGGATSAISGAGGGAGQNDAPRDQRLPDTEVLNPDLTVNVMEGVTPPECSSFTKPRAVVLGDPAENAAAQARLATLQLDQKVQMMYGWPNCSYNNGNECFTQQGVEGLVPPWPMRDGPRGVRGLGGVEATTFPVAAARAATFDVDLEERIGAVIGREMVALGYDIMLAPTINTLRHPGWGRAQETYGEDPVVLGKFGAALTRGLQTEIPACVKHYAGNNTDNNRTTVSANMDEQTLRENYTRQFKITVEDADPGCFMAAYNKVNGTFSAENAHLMTEILRDEWQWKGLALSDWGATKSTAPSANAGLDLEMPNSQFFSSLLGEVESGVVSAERVNEAVLRNFNVRETWGQFDEAFLNRPLNPAIIDDPASNALALEAAEKGAVLLRNEGAVLPLDPAGRYLLAGPDGRVARLGDRGSSDAQPAARYRTTPFDGLSARAAAGGGTIDFERDHDAALAAAANYDAVILIVGMEHRDEGENFNQGGDRDDLGLSNAHPVLWAEAGIPMPATWITELAAVNPNLIVVLEVGSAVVEPALDAAAAVVHASYPGQAGGIALGNLLYGDVNFSGKLPFTVANSEAEYPEFGNSAADHTYDYFHGYRKFDNENVVPKHYFGFGLSYTTYEYANLRVPCTAGVSESGALVAQVDVTNTGAVAGTEVVQMYVGYSGRDVVRRPVKELKAFTRVDLAPGETRTVALSVPASELRYFDQESNSWRNQVGAEHTVLVGPSADPVTLLSETFTITP